MRGMNYISLGLTVQCQIAPSVVDHVAQEGMEENESNKMIIFHPPKVDEESEVRALDIMFDLWKSRVQQSQLHIESAKQIALHEFEGDITRLVDQIFVDVVSQQPQQYEE